MELETAARKHLLDKVTITTLVGQRVWKFRPQEPLEGTGHAGIVVVRRGQWTKPTHNSQEYPMLVVECYADHSRAADGEALKDDAEERCYQVGREVDRVLHQVDREHRHWPEGDTDGLYVIGSFRGSEPSDPADKFGVKCVRLTFDVQVFHSG